MRAEGLRCLRCAAMYEPGAMFAGCPACAGRGTPTNLSVTYDEAALTTAIRHRPSAPGSMWRYGDLLPVAPGDVTTLGEGGTPLVPAPRLAARLGLRELYLKDESRNPTGSFKDRLAAVAVSVARGMGMRVITGSSSGNAGAATAAFAARAGLPCVMLTTKQFPIAMKTQMAVYGTLLLAAPTVTDRWRIVAQAVERLGWFPVTVYTYPYFGSNCYGIEGYKTIGYEIVDQLGRAPGHVVVPVGAGDAFTGIWKGLREYQRAGVLDTMPVLHAAEVLGPLEHALTEGLDDCVEMPGGAGVAVSVGSNLSTFQALNVLRDTGGAARSATDDEMLAMQRDLAALEGLYVETSSALAVAAIPRLVEAGAIDPDATVVAVLTSTGLKHPELTAEHLPPLPDCGDNLDSAVEALHRAYGFSDN